MQKLIEQAEAEGVGVAWHDFGGDTLGLYVYDDIPMIGIDKSIKDNLFLSRCVLAEELGHHFTSVGRSIYYCRSLRNINVCKSEHKALRWAAWYLIPRGSIKLALLDGADTVKKMAHYFRVTEEMIWFRLRIREKLSDQAIVN